MKKNFKISLLAVSAFALAGVATVGLNQPATASANQTSGFYMEDGAAIRLTDENEKLGIRFESKMTEAYYNSLIENKENPVVRVGAFVNTAEAFADQEWVDGSTALTLPADTEDVKVGLVNEKSFDNVSELSYYSKIVYDKEELKTAWNVDDAYINQYFNAIRAVELTAQAYVSVTVGDATTYYFAEADDVTRSMRGVAYDETKVQDSEFEKAELAPYYGTENEAVENAYLEADQLLATLSDGTYAVMIGARKCADVEVAEGKATLTADQLNAIAGESDLGDSVDVALFNETSVTPVNATKITKLVKEASDIDNPAIGLTDEATGRYYVADATLSGELTLRKNDTLKADTEFKATTVSDVAQNVANGENTLNVKVAKIQRAYAERLEFSVNDGTFFNATDLAGLTFTGATQNASMYTLGEEDDAVSLSIAAADLTVTSGKISGVTVYDYQVITGATTEKINNLQNYTGTSGKFPDVAPLSWTLETEDSTINLTSVYAYTQIIDEASDFSVFTIGKTSSKTVHGYYVLGGDINMERWTTVNNIDSWSGTTYHGKTHGFRGVFDGRGYQLKNYTARDGGLFNVLALQDDDSKDSIVAVVNVAFTNMKVDKNATRPAVLAFAATAKTNSDIISSGATLINNVYVQYATGETNIAPLLTVAGTAMVTNTVIDYSTTSIDFDSLEDAKKTGVLFGTLTLDLEVNTTTKYTVNPYQNVFIKGNEKNNVPATYCNHENGNPYGTHTACTYDYYKVKGTARAYSEYATATGNTPDTYGEADADGFYNVDLLQVWDITNVTFTELPNDTLNDKYYFDFNEFGFWKVDNGNIAWNSNAQA